MSSSTRSIAMGIVALALVAGPATQSAAPPQAAAADRPDLHSWRLTRHGFGQLKVGLNRTKIERRTGRTLKFSYNTGSCAISGISGAPGLSVMTVRGRLVRVDVGKGSWRTSEGVRVGDSESDVRARYPQLRTRPHPYDPDGKYLIVPGPHRRVVFEMNGDDEVTGFRGGRVPEVMYIEGCA